MANGIRDLSTMLGLLQTLDTMEQEKRRRAALQQFSQMTRSAFSGGYSPDKLSQLIAQIMATNAPGNLEYANQLRSLGSALGKLTAPTDPISDMTAQMPAKVRAAFEAYVADQTGLTSSEIPREGAEELFKTFLEKDQTTGVAPLDTYGQRLANILTEDKIKDLGRDPETGEGIFYDPKRATISRRKLPGMIPMKQEALDSTTRQKLDSLYSVMNIGKRLLPFLGDKDFVGFLQGRVGKLKEKFMDTPRFTRFRNMVSQLVSIIYGISGKAINEGEIAWLNSILPQLENQEGNFLANLTSIMEWVTDQYNTTVKNAAKDNRYTSRELIGEDLLDELYMQLDDAARISSPGRSPLSEEERARARKMKKLMDKGMSYKEAYDVTASQSNPDKQKQNKKVVRFKIK